LGRSSIAARRAITVYESRPCTADRPVEEDEPLAAVRAFDAFAYGDPCILWCGNELLTPPSKARGICERCWIDNGRGAKPIQLALNFNAMR